VRALRTHNENFEKQAAAADSDSESEHLQQRDAYDADGEHKGMDVPMLCVRCPGRARRRTHVHSLSNRALATPVAVAVAAAVVAADTVAVVAAVAVTVAVIIAVAVMVAVIVEVAVVVSVAVLVLVAERLRYNYVCMYDDVPRCVYLSSKCSRES
jgi:hypothetical protein